MLSSGALAEDKQKVDPFVLEGALRAFTTSPLDLPSSPFAEFTASKDTLDGDIIKAIIDGKFPLEEIASENSVNIEYVQRMKQTVKDLLGLDSPISTLTRQKITRAIIDERLSTSSAADAYGVSSSYISKVKRGAKEAALELWYREGAGGSFGSLFP